MADLLPYVYLVFVIILVGGLLLLVLLSKNYKPKPLTLPYVKVPLLTEPELRFFSLLESILPDNCYLLAQVRLANLVAVKQGIDFSWKYFSPIGMKCVDFVVCDHRSMRPLLVIELDDCSHDRPERQQRDLFVDQVLGSVDVPILHWPTQRVYSRSAVAQEIRNRMRRYQRG